MNVTKQQVFDAGWNGLKAQGFVKSVSVDYDRRGEASRWLPRGLWNCAPHDQERCCVIEHATVVAGQGLWSEAANGDTWLQELMLCHNDAASPSDMERRLREFAAAHSLTVPGGIPSVRERLDAIYGGKLNERPDTYEGMLSRANFHTDASGVRRYTE